MLTSNKQINLWYKKATVRALPRVVLENYEINSNKNYYPKVKQPIVFHPLIAREGRTMCFHILQQSCYQFFEEIAGIEENIVIVVANKILQGEYLSDASESIRQSLRSICIDEYFHSYVANDYRQQLIEITNIEPLIVKTSSTLDSMRKISTTLENEQREFFELVALCLVENTISDALLDYTIDEDCHQSFIDINRYHLQDEARHGVFFRELFKKIWQETFPEVKREVALLLPGFIKEALEGYEEKIYYIKLLLRSLDFSNDDIQLIIDDTYPDVRTTINFSSINLAAHTNLELLKKVDIFSMSDVKQAFIQAGFSI
ncbi:TPA: diiron oxygenase [Legionella pneumophila]|nr:diiron oxygenase [Legionella pneumophila]